MPERIPLLLFSGGADSTLLLKWQLAESNCDVLYIDGNQHWNKIVAETTASERAIAEILTTAEHRIRTQFDLRETMELPTGSAVIWQQLVPWLVGAVLTIDPERHSQLQVGYVMSDEMAGNLDRITKAWDALVAAVIGDRWCSQKGRFVPVDLPIVFRLRHMRKKQIYQELGGRLLDLTWSCEKPLEGATGPIPCTSCPACITRFTAMVDFKGPHEAEKEKAAHIEGAKRFQQERHKPIIAVGATPNQPTTATRKKATKKSVSKTRKTTKKK